MKEHIQNQIQNTIQNNRIVLFMKGTKEAPQCGFSAQVVKLLNQYAVPFETMDVLSDWDLREGLKEFSQWPTFPQLYVDQKLIGGSDITMQLHQSGELATILK